MPPCFERKLPKRGHEAKKLHIPTRGAAVRYGMAAADTDSVSRRKAVAEGGPQARPCKAGKAENQTALHSEDCTALHSTALPRSALGQNVCKVKYDSLYGELSISQDGGVGDQLVA